MRRFTLLVVAACGATEQQAPPAPPPPPVDVATLKPGEVVESSEYLATLRSRTAATIQPQVEGQITQILVKPGDKVAAGQPLLQIDPGPQPAAVAQAQAARTSRAAALQLAEQNLARVQSLVATGALARQELDNAQAAVATARADVDSLGAQVTSNQVRLHYYRVLAPGPGIVGDIPWRIGDTVTPQTRLTSVTDNATLEARIPVPVERATAITNATRIDIVDPSGKPLGTGTVKFVSPQVNPETQSVLVSSDIDNAKGLLRTDQVASARVVWNVRQGLRVPALAVTRLGGQSFVFVAAQQGAGWIAQQRPVKLGELADNQYAVLDGLEAGERLIVSGIQKLRDKAPIQVKG